MPDTKDTPAAAPALAAQLDPNELVPIFNHNPPGGDYVHHLYEDVKVIDENGKERVTGRKRVAEFRAVGRGFSNVPRWVADKWKKMFPGVVVDAASVGRSTVPTIAPEQIASVVNENAALKARLDSMQKVIDALQAAPAAPAK